MTAILIIQCGLIIAVSLLGGWLPLRMGPSHRAMQIALSFVAGTMFGLAMLDLFPEAVHADLESTSPGGLEYIILWVIAGFLTIFILERFVCFHHHEIPNSDDTCSHHEHSVSWIATALGLSLHGVMAGIALAASATLGLESEQAIPGFAMLLAIVLHKPFDSMSLIAIMTADGRSRGSRVLANLIFSLVTPIGVMIGVFLGLGDASHTPIWLGPALGFAVGMFLCVSLCDLLPELQFHRHDRVLLTLALLLGLGVAWVAGLFHEHHHHEHGSEEKHPPAMVAPIENHHDHDH